MLWSKCAKWVMYKKVVRGVENNKNREKRHRLTKLIYKVSTIFNYKQPCKDASKWPQRALRQRRPNKRPAGSSPYHWKLGGLLRGVADLWAQSAHHDHSLPAVEGGKPISDPLTGVSNAILWVRKLRKQWEWQILRTYNHLGGVHCSRRGEWVVWGHWDSMIFLLSFAF